MHAFCCLQCCDFFFGKHPTAGDGPCPLPCSLTGRTSTAEGGTRAVAEGHAGSDAAARRAGSNGEAAEGASKAEGGGGTAGNGGGSEGVGGAGLLVPNNPESRYREVRSPEYLQDAGRHRNASCPLRQVESVQAPVVLPSMLPTRCTACHAPASPYRAALLRSPPGAGAGGASVGASAVPGGHHAGDCQQQPAYQRACGAATPGVRAGQGYATLASAVLRGWALFCGRCLPLWPPRCKGVRQKSGRMALREGAA